MADQIVHKMTMKRGAQPAQYRLHHPTDPAKSPSMLSQIHAAVTLDAVDKLERQAAGMTGASAKTRRSWQRAMDARRRALVKL
jgi:hypothetical protein